MLSKVFTWNDFSVFTETVKAENDKAIQALESMETHTNALAYLVKSI